MPRGTFETIKIVNKSIAQEGSLITIVYGPVDYASTEAYIAH